MVWPLSKRLLHFSDKHCCVERLYIFVCLLCLSVLSLNTTLIATNIYYFSIDGFIFTKRFLKNALFRRKDVWEDGITGLTGSKTGKMLLIKHFPC